MADFNIVEVDNLPLIVEDAKFDPEEHGFVAGHADALIITSATSVQAFRDGVYTEPGSAAQRSIASASSADNAAGTGARTVRITYYDGSMNGPLTETITMNGLTPVNTVATNIRFIEKMEVITVGSVGVNLGAITLYGSTGGGGGTVGQILFGLERTRWLHHYVGIDKTMYILNMTGGSKGTVSGVMLFKQKNPLNANDIDSGGQLTDIATGAGQISRRFDPPIKVSGPSRVVGFIWPNTATNNEWHGSMDWMEK